NWRRKQEERSLIHTVFSHAIPIVLFTGLGVTALIIFLKNLKSDAARSISWKRVAWWSLVALAGNILAISFGSAIPAIMNRYDTAIPLKMFFGTAAIALLISALITVGGTAVLFAMAWYFGARAFGKDRLPSWAGMPPKYYRDALWIGLGGTAGLLGLGRLLAVASSHWPTVHRSMDAGFGTDFDNLIPAAAIVGGTVLHSLLLTGLVTAIAAFIADRVRRSWLRILLLLVGALALVGGSWGSSADFGKQ